MRRINLPRGKTVGIGVAGSGSILIINNPSLEYPEGANPKALPLGSYILGAFDAQPFAEAARADLTIPPWTEAEVPIPAGVTTLYLVAPSDPAAFPWVPAGPNAGPGDAFAYYALLAVPAAPGLRRSPHGWPLGVGGVVGVDAFYNSIVPEPSTPVYDQQFEGAGNNNQWRPILAASLVDTFHQVTVAGTLYALMGNQIVWDYVGTAPPGWRVIHRLYISASAATLVVWGGAGLTVGSPGAQEYGRVAMPAAGIQMVDYGPAGILLGSLNETTGIGKIYASAAVTLDVTVVGG